MTSPLRMLRTDASHPDFLALVRLLDHELAERDGAEHSFYAQYNTVTTIRQAVVVYVGEVAVGCGAIKPIETDAMEVKRMYVRADYRGQRIAEAVLTELENWAQESGATRCVLETGKRQPEAIRLYERCGYLRTPNYGQYAGVENSVCFEKRFG